jgi:hypothetical protein
MILITTPPPPRTCPALPYCTVQVEWEFWTNSNDECGVLCDKQRKFIKVRPGTQQQM